MNNSEDKRFDFLLYPTNCLGFLSFKINLLFLTSGIFSKYFQLLFFKGIYLSNKPRAYSITFFPLIGL